MTDLTEAKARAAIAPWYSLFNIASRGDVRAIQEKILTEDYESCAGYLPGECWGRETSIKVVSNFATTIPDMTFDIKEVLVAGDRVIVRGEVTGTPAGDLFGVPHAGKSFRIMAVDIQTIRDGKDLPHGKLAQRHRPAPRQIGRNGVAGCAGATVPVVSRPW
jgi:ketosteroid isomerase-like protein